MPEDLKPGDVVYILPIKGHWTTPLDVTVEAVARIYFRVKYENLVFNIDTLEQRVGSRYSIREWMCFRKLEDFHKWKTSELKSEEITRKIVKSYIKKPGVINRLSSHTIQEIFQELKELDII